MKIPKWGILAVVLIVALSMLFMIAPAHASPDIYPCNFYGTAMINGLPVGAGTGISAWFGGSQVASTVTGGGSLANNEFALSVELDEANEGAEISFMIGSLWANETSTWQKLQFVEVNLTATTGDSTPPTVISTSPVNDATGVSIDTLVMATFSEAIDPATLVFSLDSVVGALNYTGVTATFNPTANLAYSTTYNASIQASDLAGNPMAAPYTWSFTTGSEPPVGPPPVGPPDNTPPIVISTSPVNGATDAEVDTLVTATFSEAIDPATLVFSLDGVFGNVSYADTTATFDPTGDLDYSTTYNATIQASDLAGNPMASPYNWSFTTEAEPAEAERPKVGARLYVHDINILSRSVYPNQPVTIYVEVTNAGDMAGSKMLTLMINGEPDQSTHVGVGPHSSQTVSFTVYRADPGQYNVSIGSVSSSFAVGEILVASGSSGELDTGDIIAIVVIAVIIILGIIVVFLFIRRSA